MLAELETSKLAIKRLEAGHHPALRNLEDLLGDVVYELLRVGCGHVADGHLWVLMHWIGKEWLSGGTCTGECPWPGRTSQLWPMGLSDHVSQPAKETNYANVGGCRLHATFGQAMHVMVLASSSRRGQVSCQGHIDLYMAVWLVSTVP